MYRFRYPCPLAHIHALVAPMRGVYCHGISLHPRGGLERIPEVHMELVCESTYHGSLTPVVVAKFGAIVGCPD